MVCCGFGLLLGFTWGPCGGGQVEQPEMLQGGQLRHYQLGGLKFLLSLFNNNMNGAPQLCTSSPPALREHVSCLSTTSRVCEGKPLLDCPSLVLSKWGHLAFTEHDICFGQSFKCFAEHGPIAALSQEDEELHLEVPGHWNPFLTAS